MKLEFDKLPINTLIGASWGTFKAIAKGQKIDKGYRQKYYLTKAICGILSTVHFIESYRYKKLLESKPLANDPVFVLGHWRSGTTFVHNVLSCDKQFGYTTTYQTVFPHAMLFGQKMFKPIMGKIMPDKRPTDNLELNPNLPQEEEFALSAMMPYSYYNFWFFPKKMMEYCDRYLLMKGQSEEEKNVFRKTFLKLIKISLYNSGGERYLSKNPPHTGRVAELVEMFPNAKFIFLMRNPYTVFESTKSFFTSTIQPLKLQDITNEEIESNFITAYSKLYDQYQSQKHLIPKGNLIEIKFEDFESDPIEATKRIYNTLSLKGFEDALPAMEKYVGKKKGYKKNSYDYAPSTRKIVEDNWSKALTDWNYKI
ncbi:MAG: sulfotransferase [Rikenellaceae bacterium]